MKFAKTITHLGEIDKTFGPHYIQFKLLKKYLKEVAGREDAQTQATFVQLVENEHGRVKKLIEYKVAELQLLCSNIVTNIRVLDTNTDANSEGTHAQLIQLTGHADQLATTLASTERFVHYNKEGFRKIVKKHDKVTNMNLSWMEAQRLRTFFVHAESDLERLLVELSDIYKYIHAHTDEAGPGEHQVSDATFERKSYKYWVAIEDVFQFKTKMIKHLPLHIFARKTDAKFHPNPRGRRKSVAELLIRDDEEEDRTEYTKLGWISSVYFDNDEMDCYRTRVDFEEGATLFRVRWYGDPKDQQRTDITCLPRAPKKGCYYERKTHHESWVLASSVKERFPVPEHLILPFMKGEVGPDEVLKDDKLLGLAEEMQSEITRRRLHPIIRTAYKRAAFQQDATNDVRITLDTNLTFVNERWPELEVGAWKRDEEEVEGHGDWREFPYAVLEVKLKAEEPQWLQEILNEPYIRTVHKFSKFQQATSTYYPHKIHKFPYWYSEEDVQNAKSRLLSEEEKRQKKGETSVKKDSEEASTDAEGITNTAFEPDQDTSLTPATYHVASEEIKVFTDPGFHANSVAADVTEGRYKKHRQPWSSKWKKSKKGSKTAENNGGNFGGIPGKEGKDKSKFATARVKIEPKTFFANERTFLQWLRSGMSLFSLGGILYGLSPDRASQISGLVFSAMSLVICLYGLGMFYWRMYMIKNRRTKRFDDWFGPSLLAFLIISGLVVSIVLQQVMAPAGTQALPPGASTRACLHQTEVSGFPAFAHPRGLTMDPASGNLLSCAGGTVAVMDKTNGDVTDYITLNGVSECKTVAAAGRFYAAVVEDVTSTADRKRDMILIDVDTHQTVHSIDISHLIDGEVTGSVHYPGVFRNYSSLTLAVEGTLFLSTSTSTLAVVVARQEEGKAAAIVSFALDEGAEYLATAYGTLYMGGDTRLSRWDLGTGRKLEDWEVVSDTDVTLAGLSWAGAEHVLGITRTPVRLINMVASPAQQIIQCADIDSI